MAIEFPSKPDVLAKRDVLAKPEVLDERLAALEAAFFADQVLHESPALTAPEPPRTQREILAWTTRGFGTALIAVTAALSVATGYVLMERSHAPAAAPQPAQHAVPAAAVVLPHRHAAAVAQHHTAAHPAAPAAHHASAPVVYHAAPQSAVVRTVPHAAVRHVAPAVVTHAAPVHHAALAPATHRTAQSVPAQHRVRTAAPQTAAEQLAAWEATHPASQARASTTSSTEPAPQTRPRSEPASATDTATASGTRPEPASTTSVPGAGPDTGRGGGTRMPPTNPGGIWNERLPGGGTLGGSIGPIIGVPRDSCTPRGGRVGIVMEAISVLTSRGH
ncbi:MAG TPA: hypothetical protein VE826_06120 [Dongiaceae bacterium]|nr:hypothetical protein [Dongiaceae bacterium]